MNLCIISSSLIDADKTIHSTQENVDAVHYLLQTILQKLQKKEAPKKQR